MTKEMPVYHSGPRFSLQALGKNDKSCKIQVFQSPLESVVVGIRLHAHRVAPWQDFSHNQAAMLKAHFPNFTHILDTWKSDLCAVSVQKSSKLAVL